MNDKFRNAQLAYDHMLPDDEPAFLETPEGNSWIDDEAEALIDGRDVMIGRKTVVEAYQLSDAVAELAIGKDDEDGMLGQLLVAVANYDISCASACLNKLLGIGAVTEIAYGLLEPHAEDAKQQMIEDGEWEE